MLSNNTYYQISARCPKYLLLHYSVRLSQFYWHFCESIFFFQFCNLKFGCSSWNSNCFWDFHDNILYRYLPKRPRCNTCLEFNLLKFQFPTFFENKNNCVGLENGASKFLANQDMSSCKLQGGGLKITMVIMSFSRNHTYVEHYTWNLSYLSFKGRTGFAEKFWKRYLTVDRRSLILSEF